MTREFSRLDTPLLAAAHPFVPGCADLTLPVDEPCGLEAAPSGLDLKSIHHTIRAHASTYYPAQDPRCDDLYQDGWVEALKRLPKFQPTKGSLRAYMDDPLRKAICVSFHQRRRTIHVPKDLASLVWQVSRDERDRLGHEPTHREVFERLVGLNHSDVPKKEKTLNTAISIVLREAVSVEGSTVEDDECASISYATEMVSDEPTPEQRFDSIEQQRGIRLAVSSLAPEAREVILRYHGFNAEPQTMGAIASELGVSISTVDRRLKTGYAQLREQLVASAAVLGDARGARQTARLPHRRPKNDRSHPTPSKATSRSAARLLPEDTLSFMPIAISSPVPTPNQKGASTTAIQPMAARPKARSRRQQLRAPIRSSSIEAFLEALNELTTTNNSPLLHNRVVEALRFIATHHHARLRSPHPFPLLNSHARAFAGLFLNVGCSPITVATWLCQGASTFGLRIPSRSKFPAAYLQAYLRVLLQVCPGTPWKVYAGLTLPVDTKSVGLVWDAIVVVPFWVVDDPGSEKARAEAALKALRENRWRSCSQQQLLSQRALKIACGAVAIGTTIFEAHDAVCDGILRPEGLLPSRRQNPEKHLETLLQVFVEIRSALP